LVRAGGLGIDECTAGDILVASLQDVYDVRLDVMNLRQFRFVMVAYTHSKWWYATHPVVQYHVPLHREGCLHFLVIDVRHWGGRSSRYACPQGIRRSDSLGFDNFRTNATIHSVHVEGTILVHHLRQS